jgi:hypothetical protein
MLPERRGPPALISDFAPRLLRLNDEAEPPRQIHPPPVHRRIRRERLRVSVSPRRLFGKDAPSNRLNLAAIGVGGQGGANLKACPGDTVALATWTGSRGEDVPALSRAKKFRDYREMLEKERGSTRSSWPRPDHTHAVITLAAMQAGKHVFCQKPLTHTVYEARRSGEVARRYKVQTQTGNPGGIPPEQDAAAEARGSNSPRMIGDVRRRCAAKRTVPSAASPGRYPQSRPGRRDQPVPAIQPGPATSTGRRAAWQGRRCHADRVAVEVAGPGWIAGTGWSRGPGLDCGYRRGLAADGTVRFAAHLRRTSPIILGEFEPRASAAGSCSGGMPPGLPVCVCTL